ncbi:MAG TPA: FG-GAP repeat protein, partial [Gemmataceae bacterium]|nr:FG-GAP repeat protein [Gemmataceae bacterium]
FDPRFTGGVSIATGDLDGNGKADLIVAAGPGGGPNVRVFAPDANGMLHLVSNFFAYSANFHGGVNVASGQGYDTPVQVLQDVPNIMALPAATTPYPPGATVPGAAQGIPLITFDPNTFRPAITVGSGDLQYLSANFLNNFGQIAYRPDITPPIPNPNNVGHIVYATWTDTTAMSNYPTDGSMPPTGVTVGPYVQLGVNAAGTPIITRLTAPTGQLSTRNQLITGAGPGGGPDVRVWTFTGTGSTLSPALAKEFMAFSPSFAGGVTVAIGDVAIDQLTSSLNGNKVVEPAHTVPGTTLLVAETTSNSGPTQETAQFPFDTNSFRAYKPSIVVAMQSGGSLARIFSDFDPLAADPTNPHSDPAPMQRSSVFDINLVPTLIDRGVVQDLTNPLNNFSGLASSTFFNRGIDPQWTGGMNVGWSAFTFAGSGNSILVGTNAFTGVGGTLTNPALAQTVFAAGYAAPPLFGRGSHIRTFNQMSEIDLNPLTPPSVSLPNYFNPIDDFFGFTNYSGTGASTSYGFGVLPTPTLDSVSLPSTITPTTVNNPILV